VYPCGVVQWLNHSHVWIPCPTACVQLYMLLVFTLIFATALYLMERGTEETFVDGTTVRVFADGTVSEIDSVFTASWVILVT